MSAPSLFDEYKLDPVAWVEEWVGAFDDPKAPPHNGGPPLKRIQSARYEHEVDRFGKAAPRWRCELIDMRARAVFYYQKHTGLGATMREAAESAIRAYGATLPEGAP